MKAFDTNKYIKQLTKINKDNNQSIDAGIQVIINLMDIYNILLKEFEAGEQTRIYLLYQMSATITNNLKLFNVYPTKEDKNSDNGDNNLSKIINNLQKKIESSKKK